MIGDFAFASVADDADAGRHAGLRSAGIAMARHDEEAPVPDISPDRKTVCLADLRRQCRLDIVSQLAISHRGGVSMPYIHLDLAGTFPAAAKRMLAEKLCRLYADVMKTQLWRPNVGIAELGENNLFHLGADGLEPVTMVLVEFRKGRPAAWRLELARGIVDICVDTLGVARKTVLVEFTPHVGEEMYRDGEWVSDWAVEEANA
jgi:phenylpyruvate tautomerase PptA (4-oxalocrotonate tautomerase family)